MTKIKKMLQEVYKSKFSRVLADPEKQLVIQEWFADSKLMTETDFKNELFALTEHGYEAFKPKKVLVLQQNFHFIVTPELQEWAAKNSGSVLEKVKAEKIAFVVSPDFFSKISVEQTMSERPDTPIKIQFFDCEEKAKEWLEV